MPDFFLPKYECSEMQYGKGFQQFVVCRKQGKSRRYVSQWFGNLPKYWEYIYFGAGFAGSAMMAGKDKSVER